MNRAILIIVAIMCCAACAILNSTNSTSNIGNIVSRACERICAGMICAVRAIFYIARTASNIRCVMFGAEIFLKANMITTISAIRNTAITAFCISGTVNRTLCGCIAFMVYALWAVRNAAFSAYNLISSVFTAIFCIIIGIMTGMTFGCVMICAKPSAACITKCQVFGLGASADCTLIITTSAADSMRKLVIRVAKLAIADIALTACCICLFMLTAINAACTASIMEHMTHTEIMICAVIVRAILAIHKICSISAVIYSTLSGYKIMYARHMTYYIISAVPFTAKIAPKHIMCIIFFCTGGAFYFSCRINARRYIAIIIRVFLYKLLLKLRIVAVCIISRYTKRHRADKHHDCHCDSNNFFHHCFFLRCFYKIIFWLAENNITNI